MDIKTRTEKTHDFWQHFEAVVREHDWDADAYERLFPEDYSELLELYRENFKLLKNADGWPGDDEHPLNDLWYCTFELELCGFRDPDYTPPQPETEEDENLAWAALLP